MKKKQINLELQLYSMRLDNGLAKKEKKKKGAVAIEAKGKNKH